MSQSLGPNQQKLVNALRSGDYKQCRMFLSKNGCYCALGVACKVAEKEGIDLQYYENGEIRGSDLVYQPVVRRFFGFHTFRGGYDEDHSIPHLNDEQRMPLREIAHHIETHPQEYFVVTV